MRTNAAVFEESCFGREILESSLSSLLGELAETFCCTHPYLLWKYHNSMEDDSFHTRIEYSGTESFYGVARPSSFS